VFREHLTAKGSANTVLRNQKLFNGEQRIVIAAISINQENIFNFQRIRLCFKIRNQMKDERSLTGEFKRSHVIPALASACHFPNAKNGGALKFKVFVGSQ